MLAFDAPLFAVAGLLAAAGPILIHLLNRRRYREVSWGAMDFLRHALERNRRSLKLRDLALLAIRVLCVLCVGLALARPHYRGAFLHALWHGAGFAALAAMLFGAILWGVVHPGNRRQQILSGGVAIVAGVCLLWSGVIAFRDGGGAAVAAASHRQPVHAILLLDNSRSMGAESVGTTLLERAKTRAREFFLTLPSGSRMTVIPLAGADEPTVFEGFRHRDDAERALDRIPLSDAAGNISRGLEQAAEAAAKVTDLAEKRAVLFTDLQQSAFRDTSWRELLSPLGGLQIVPVSAEPPANVWVAGFHLEEGLASSDAPARFLARIASGGGQQTTAVLVRLAIDGVEVASQTVEITAGQMREVSFLQPLENVIDHERPNFVAAELSLQSDAPAANQLSADDRRWLIVPVVADLPVVFVDEWGGDEDVSQNHLGETYALRRLLAPQSAGDLGRSSLIRVVHVRQDELTEELLRDARLVVMAGVASPDEGVSLLREFVVQGGPLVILAGGSFDPRAWQELAWQNGRGILPAPLLPEPLGATPEEAGDGWRPFFAAFESMHHDSFLIEQEDPEQLAAIFNATPFFKAVQADLSSQVIDNLLSSQTRRFTMEADDSRLRDPEPDWWRWSSPLPLFDRSLPPEELARREQPRLLAEFRENHRPFAIARRIGAGQVVLLTSGVTSDWNLLRTSGAMYFFHRLFTGLIEQTLPVRNYEAGQRIVPPVEHGTNMRYQLMRPSGQRAMLSPEVLTADSISIPIRAGIYRLRSIGPSAGDESVANGEEWQFSVNGPVSESDLTRISAAELSANIDRDDVRVLTAGENFSFEGASRRGQGFWQWCWLGALIGLLIEMALLSQPQWRRRESVA